MWLGIFTRISIDVRSSVDVVVVLVEIERDAVSEKACVSS
jgi:hypothetical protein